MSVIFILSLPVFGKSILKIYIILNYKFNKMIFYAISKHNVKPLQCQALLY